MADAYSDLKAAEVFSYDANKALFKRLSKGEPQPADDDPVNLRSLCCRRFSRVMCSAEFQPPLTGWRLRQPKRFAVREQR